MKISYATTFRKKPFIHALPYALLAICPHYLLSSSHHLDQKSARLYFFFHYRLSWLTEDLQKLGNAVKLDATNLSDWQHLFKTVASPLPADQNRVSSESYLQDVPLSFKTMHPPALWNVIQSLPITLSLASAP